MARRLGLFGGTFDPPHIGHAVAATHARAQLDLDEVALVVANSPWQKVGSREITPAEVRFQLVEQACRTRHGLRASRIEIERGGSSYMIDTVEALVADSADELEIWLILGADAAAGLDTWHRCDELRPMVSIAVVDRPGGGEPPAGWTHASVDIPALDVSSTELRRRFCAGEPTAVLVDPDVEEEILRRGLYRL